MSSNFVPVLEQEQGRNGERGASQRILLLVLVLLVAVFGYLYYFTGLIRPRVAAPPPPPSITQVKQPIPARPDPAKVGETSAKPDEAKAPAQQPAQPAPVASAAPAPPAKPAGPATPAAQAVPPKAPAPAPPAPQAKGEPAKPAPPTPASKAKAAAAQPPVTAKATEAKPKKEIAAAKPTVKAAAATPPGEKKAVGKEGGVAIAIDGLVGEQSVRDAISRLKKAGIAPVRKITATKPASMTRLFVAEFADHDAAEGELGKLRKETGDAFLLREKNGLFALYGGSYHASSKASAEGQRLNAKGIRTQMRTVSVPVPVTKLIAGSFSSRAEAQSKAASLKRHGVTAMVVKSGS